MELFNALIEQLPETTQTLTLEPRIQPDVPDTEAVQYFYPGESRPKKVEKTIIGLSQVKYLRIVRKEGDYTVPLDFHNQQALRAYLPRLDKKGLLRF